MACALVLTEMGYEYDDALIRHLVFAGEFTIEDFHATGSTHEERTDRYMFARGVNHSITALVTHMQEIHEEGKKKGRW